MVPEGGVWGFPCNSTANFLGEIAAAAIRAPRLNAPVAGDDLEEKKIHEQDGPKVSPSDNLRRVRGWRGRKEGLERAA